MPSDGHKPRGVVAAESGDGFFHGRHLLLGCRSLVAVVREVTFCRLHAAEDLFNRDLHARPAGAVRVQCVSVGELADRGSQFAMGDCCSGAAVNEDIGVFVENCHLELQL